MKMRPFVLLAAALMLFSISAPAQVNTLTVTTLSGAIDASTTRIVVASATGISTSPPTLLYCEREAMPVVAVSGTVITVVRGGAGTRSEAHATARAVFVGRPDWYYAVDPVAGGAVTFASTYADPYINVINGTIWRATSGFWGLVGAHGSAAPPARRAVADAATTATVYDYIVAYTSISTARAVTIPAAAAMPGQVLIITDESGSANSYNITIVGTVNGSSNPTAISAAYGTYKIYSNGTAWFTLP